MRKDLYFRVYVCDNTHCSIKHFVYSRWRGPKLRSRCSECGRLGSEMNPVRSARWLSQINDYGQEE